MQNIPYIPYPLFFVFRKSLIIHEENTNEISGDLTMSVILCDKMFAQNFSLIFTAETTLIYKIDTPLNLNEMGRV